MSWADAIAEVGGGGMKKTRRNIVLLEFITENRYLLNSKIYLYIRTIV